MQLRRKVATRPGRLAAIKQPALVANGDHDVMIPTKNTELLGKHLPDATVKIYGPAV